MLPPVLEFSRFGIAFGVRVVLACVNLEVPARGTLALMGPVGVGKSTLLRTLAGRNDGDPSLRMWGRATYRGAAWRSVPAPALVGQGTKLLVGTVLEGIVSALPNRGRLQRGAQRARAQEIFAELGMNDLAFRLDDPMSNLSRGDVRRVSIAVAVAADPMLLLADEPTAGLGEEARLQVLAALGRRAETHAVLLVTHNRADALALPGRVALLAGGAIVEEAETQAFFGSPRTPIAQAFVEMGSTSVESPPTLDQLVSDGLIPSSFLMPVERLDALPAAAFPELVLKVRWVLDGALAGVARPGLLGSVDRDLRELAAGGIRLLVCLEESQVLPPEVLARYGIDGLSLPIADMDTPSIDDALSLCAVIDGALEQRRPVAIHCRAGLGRTGTVLCAYLMWKGLGRERALSRVRAVEARFVQSERQHDFLAELEDHLRSRPDVGAAPHPPTT